MGRRAGRVCVVRAFCVGRREVSSCGPTSAKGTPNAGVDRQRCRLRARSHGGCHRRICIHAWHRRHTRLKIMHHVDQHTWVALPRGSDLRKCGGKGRGGPDEERTLPLIVQICMRTTVVGCVPGGSSSGSLQNVNDGCRPWAARSRVRRSVARTWAPKAPVLAICRPSGAGLGRGADFRGPDAIFRIASGLRLHFQNRRRKERTIVQIRALSAHFRAKVRLTQTRGRLWEVPKSDTLQRPTPKPPKTAAPAARGFPI